MNLLENKYPLIHKIVEKIAEHQGQTFLVGGAVRDMVMQLPIHDLDIEVHGLTEHQLETILSECGPVNLVGKSFGVWRVNGLDADWSLPRTDSKGRKPVVTCNPFMGIEDAARRRDLTMNAMAYNLHTQELIDPFNGKQDIANKLLRSPDPQFFTQDPLRFYRVMQFIGRFAMYPDEELNALCTTMDISTISRERIEEEFKKLLLQSKRPSLGIRWLKDIGRLKEILPELYKTIGIEQNPQWHPEGDVFEHSMQAVDAAAAIIPKYNSEFEKLILMYAALCHDLGKVTTSRIIDGVIKSYGHEKDSNKFAYTMLKRITHNNDLIRAVCSLVLYHMTPLQFTKSNAKLAAYRRLASKLDRQINLDKLLDLCNSDKRGRNGESHQPLTIEFEDVALFRKKAQAAGVLHGPLEPILKGADIADIVPAGPQMGKLLEIAYNLQIERGIEDKSELKRLLLHDKPRNNLTIGIKK